MRTSAEREVLARQFERGEFRDGMSRIFRRDKAGGWTKKQEKAEQARQDAKYDFLDEPLGPPEGWSDEATETLREAGWSESALFPHLARSGVGARAAATGLAKYRQGYATGKEALFNRPYRNAFLLGGAAVGGGIYGMKKYGPDRPDLPGWLPK